jgi:hypothetical protein
MIKAKSNNNDLILGLSEENIIKLKNGEPIKFSLTQIFPELTGNCLIFYGKTETEMMKMLPMNHKTKFHL